MKENLKYKILWIMLVIVTLIIVIIIALLNNMSTRYEKENHGNTIKIYSESELEAETDIYTYVFSESVIDKFFDNMSGKEEGIDYPEAIISVLKQEYIEKNKLTKENVLSHFEKYKNINSYSVKEIYSKKIEGAQDDIGEYIYTKGIIRKDSKEEYIYIYIEKDYIRNSYCLSIITEDEYGRVKKGEITDNKNINVKNNLYNEIVGAMVSDYQKCLIFFRDYIDTLENNPEYGYKLLDEEYRKARFANLDEYMDYIKRLGDLSKIVVREYAISETSEYKQYIAVDLQGRYYIFRVYSGMQYTLILDTYTLDIPEFTGKYTLATDQEKVILNLNKFMLAINENDYRYAYGVLANNFKKSKFPTYDSFVNYMKTGFFDRSKFDYVQFGDEAGTYYTYKVKITDAEEKDKRTIEKTFIILLGDNTDFEISFNVE